MPATKRPKPLYQRGQFALYRRDDRANLEIVWYDGERGRERSASAGTADVTAGKLALDRKYLNEGGHGLCPTCHRPMADESPLLSRAILDYLLKKEGTAGYKSSSTRLTQAVIFLAETDQKVRCSQADPEWITKYRAWLAKRPIFDTKGNKVGAYSLGHIEGCVRALASAINAAPGQRAQFTAEQPKNVSKSPTFRADIKLIAKMFSYCLRPDGRSDRERDVRRGERESLLRYLRFAVATWARPDAIMDAKQEGQWFPEARVFDLNMPGRRQTKKHRPKVAIARQFAPFLDSGEAYLSSSSIFGTWATMSRYLKLPKGREAGPKLIRRSMATMARKQIGEERWKQGEMMLGHVKFSVSDIYAIPDPANLGLALAATESLIDKIEQLAPGAFYRTGTANRAIVRVVNGGKNG